MKFYSECYKGLWMYRSSKASCITIVFFLCSEASKQKAFHNKSLGDENRKKLKSWQTSMADVQVLEFVPSQWPLRQMKWAAASSRWTLSVKADCWAPMATPRDDEENALKKKLWRKSVEETDISEYFCEKKLQKALGKPLGPILRQPWGAAKSRETHNFEGLWGSLQAEVFVFFKVSQRKKKEKKRCEREKHVFTKDFRSFLRKERFKKY